MKKLHIAHSILTAVLLVMVAALGYMQYRFGRLVTAMVEYQLSKDELQRLKEQMSPCGESADVRTYEARRR
jgi:hypothetical protein